MRRVNPVARALGWLACRPWLAALVILALSLSIQGFFLTKVPERFIRPNTQWELQAIAVSLATTGRFADAYALPTGPTAHLPPIPPAIVGLVYTLLGPTLTAGYVAWIVDMATYALLWALLPWLAPRIGLPAPAGVIAGLAGALVPHWPGHGEALTGVAVCLLMAAFVRRWSSGPRSATESLLLGIAAGVAFHVQPALLLVVLGWIGFELWWSRGRRQRFLTALVALGIAAACLPWGWRNYRAFGALVFVRSNLGLELRMGNHEGAAAAMEVMDRQGGRVYIHPRSLEAEARKVQELGEIVYMRQARREALEWIAGHPGTFAGLTASRAGQWWLGPFYDPLGALVVSGLTALALVGVWRSYPTLAVPQRAALLIPPLTFPLIYYVVAYMPRYREPLDWMFLLAAGTAVWTWLKGEPGRAAVQGR